MGLREIAHRLGVNRNPVRAIIGQKGSISDLPRKDKNKIDSELLRRLYDECNGWVQRIYEKLSEQERIKVGYSALTSMIRELDLGQSRKRRCDRVPDEPVAEMQHNTSIYTFMTGGKKVRVVGRPLYFRYLKIRYLKFYRSFNRFKWKVLPGNMDLSSFAMKSDILIEKPVGKTSLIPLKAFEHEQLYLRKVPAYVPPPYLAHERGTDQYGYASFDANFYWMPGTSRVDINLLEYSNCLKIYHKRKLLIEYPLQEDGVKNERFSPEGQPKPQYQRK